MKQMTVLMLDEIITGQSTENQVKDIEGKIFEQYKPTKFDGSGGAEIQMVKNFEQMCLVITKHTGRDAKKMTVLEYYQAFELLMQENKQKQKLNG